MAMEVAAVPGESRAIAEYGAGQRRWWQRPITFVAAALLIRMIVVLFSYADVANPAENNGNFGWEMGWVARALFLGRGFSAPFAPLTGPTALVPPLYPFLLAAIFKLFDLYSVPAAFVTLTLQSVFSALTCLPVYAIAKRTLGSKAAVWAGWGWVVYPFSVYFSAGIVWDFALTCLLFTTSFAAILSVGEASRSSVWRWGAIGILCGITALSNPSTLSVLPFLLLIATWKSSRTRGVGGWMRGAVAVLALGLTLLPWSVRNYQQMHHLVPVRDGFWLEFYAGNAGDTWESNPAWAHPASNATQMQMWIDMGEQDYLASKHAMAIAYVKAHPAEFVSVSARRFLRFWTGFWSLEKSYLHKEPTDIPNTFFCTALTIGMLIGLWRWTRQDLPGALPFLVTVLIFPLPYYLTHASMDYRQPIEAVILLLIVAGFAKRRAEAVIHSRRPA